MTIGRATGRAVIDASLAAMWVLAEPLSARALDLAAEWGASGTQILAPCFMPTEVTNAVYKRVRRREMTIQAAHEALDVVLSFSVLLDDEPDVHHRALRFAHLLDRPATYDAHYLALADLRSCDLWTGDRRLYNAVRTQLSWVKWVGDVPA